MRDLRVSFPRPCGEKWEAMTPSGCNRVCAACDKVIHDLSHYDIEEAEALLRSDPDTCVRASVDAKGVIALKPGRRGLGRMVIAVGASAGLLSAGAPALAKQERPQGAIVGKVESPWGDTRVVATGPDGKSYRTKVKADGHYRIKHVPAGTYKLTFVPQVCNDTDWTIENVVVSDAETVAPVAIDPNECIVVGMLLIDESKG